MPKTNFCFQGIARRVRGKQFTLSGPRSFYRTGSRRVDPRKNENTLPRRFVCGFESFASDAERATPNAVSCDPDVPAAILSTNTEVAIAPKSRTAPPPSRKAPSPAKLVVPNAAEGPKATPASRRALRIVPTAFFRLSGNESEPVVWVSPTDFKAITGLDKVDLQDQPYRHVSVRSLKPPATLDVNTNGTSNEPEPTSRTLQPTDGVSVPQEDSRTDTSAGAKYRLLASSHIPQYQVCVVGGDGATSGDIKDWDLVVCVLDISHLPFAAQ